MSPTISSKTIRLGLVYTHDAIISAGQYCVNRHSKRTKALCWNFLLLILGSLRCACQPDRRHNIRKLSKISERSQNFPTAKIHSYNTRASVSKNFYIQKSNTEIKRKSFSRIGSKRWNEIPAKLRALPKATFKKQTKMILLNILENKDSYKDLDTLHSCSSLFSHPVLFHILYVCYVA